MRFIFEIKREMQLSDQSVLNLLRRMMVSFETMVNTVLPSLRIHLSEETDNKNDE